MAGKQLHTKWDDWFINLEAQGRIPPVDTPEYDALVDQEVERCILGVYIDGVYFHGWFYWHINHWWIRIDIEDENGTEKREERHPDNRDNEWIRMEHLVRCSTKPRKGYIEVGGRQGGKSEMEASYLGWNATLFQHTQNVIICGNDGDLSLLKDKVDFGLRKLWKGIAIPRLDKTWKGSQVRLGYKTPDGENEVWSYIMIRNAKDGHNTEAGAGTTAKSLIMDEIGKYLFGAVYQAIEPAFKGKFGWRGVPMMVGTGGAFDNGADAENFFFNPESNNFLGLDREDGVSGKTGLFLSGLYRQDCKVLKTLGDYLVEEQGIEVDKKSDLFKMPMWVSDKNKARLAIEQEREALKNNPDRTLYLKTVMYYPLTVEECFLSSQENMFDVQSAKIQKQKLLNQGKTGKPVKLFLEDGKVRHEFSDQLPISNFPLKPSDTKDAPVVIYEFPIENPPYGLYVAGVDPYRQGKAEYSSSLGAIYIYKRMNNLLGEKYQDMFVASYCARPDRKEHWEAQARYLIKFYNARALVENDEISFIDYMVAKGDSHYLEKQPQWLREVVPNTTVNRDFGIHRSADKIRTHLHNQMKDYLEEQIIQEKDEEGKIINEVLGVNRILDPVLLEEIIQFHDDLNTDRLVAAELALAQANKMDPIMGAVNEKGDPRVASIYNRKKKRKKGTFVSGNKGMFHKRKHKTFR
jgi:hypothetical protein